MNCFINWNLKRNISLFKKKGWPQGQLGLEKEGLRITPKGQLSEQPHPKSLGSKLTHPHITTDFAEAQLELVTPPVNKEGAALTFMRAIHQYIYENNPRELIWPLSLPPSLKAGPAIADFGTTAKGKAKSLYRQGLVERYGFEMQMISGIHLSYSFSDEVFAFLYKEHKPNISPNDFISEAYLHLVRNYLRDGYLITYLFGASPSKTLPYSTSLRMSEHGYYSRIQQQLAISFNSRAEYVRDLEYALTTPLYKDISPSKQLNPGYLQIENEHYVRIRPKALQVGDETPLEAIKARGISYVETRSLDINPFDPVGITRDEIDFMLIFLTTCLLSKSPKLNKKESFDLFANQSRIALEGRSPKVKVHIDHREVLFRTRAKRLLKEMRPVAHLLGKRFEDNLDNQLEKIDHPDTLTSARIENSLDFGLELAKAHKEKLTKLTPNQSLQKRLKRETELSLIAFEALEKEADFYLSGYEDMEVSTQSLIREAHKRGIQVDILDRSANFIRLRHGKKSELIKEATKTSRDSYITFLAMENKVVTKKLLDEAGLLTPKGEHFLSLKDALASPPKKRVVVKPTTSNFGLGIHIVEKGNHIAFEGALKSAFDYSNSIIVEEFCPGKEYRFLVIGNKCAAVAYREPANVVGDGENTIAELIKIKNLKPENHKHPKVKIRLTPIERGYLARQKLKPSSVLPKGKKVYLRENSNVSTGGDAIDVTDEMDPKHKKLAIKAAKLLGAEICGVDLMIHKEEATVLELNFNPTLALHEFPFRGKPRPVSAALLDHLGF